MSATEEHCQTCGHYADWHPRFGGTRRGCEWIDCDCEKYVPGEGRDG